MKVLYISLALIITGSVQAQKKNFEIVGELKGLKNNTCLYLIHNKDEHGPDTLSRIQSRGEKFIFTGVAPFYGEAYFIKIDTIKTKYETPIKGYITIVIDYNKILLKGSIGHLEIDALSITGSKSQDDYVLFMNGQKEVMTKETLAANNLSRVAVPGNKDTLLIQRCQDVYDSSKKVTDAFRVNWISEHSNSTLAPWVILTSVQDVSKRAEAFDKLGPVAKQSKYGRFLYNEIAKENMTAVGKAAPNFSFPTIDGKDISLTDAVKQGKFTVIDFWASWCGPCRKTIPELKNLYDKYHEKGLNILGYSVDEKDEDWKMALGQFQMPWVNVRETIKNFAGDYYNVQALPKTVVLDHDGKVVAKGLVGKDLEKKIEELLVGNK